MSLDLFWLTILPAFCFISLHFLQNLLLPLSFQHLIHSIFYFLGDKCSQGIQSWSPSKCLCHKKYNKSTFQWASIFSQVTVALLHWKKFKHTDRDSSNINRRIIFFIVILINLNQIFLDSFLSSSHSYIVPQISICDMILSEDSSHIFLDVCIRNHLLFPFRFILFLNSHICCRWIVCS